MTEHEASRTLVKSPPELWAECSDAASLARHLDRFGEIRITRLDPETAVAWEGERARGTVRIEPAGWGTRVTLTAVPAEEPSPPAPAADEPGVVAADEPGVVAAEEPAAAPGPVPPSPEPVGVADQAAADEAAADQPAASADPTPRRRFARVRAFFRGRPAEPDVGLVEVPEPEVGLAEVPEPEPPAPEPPAPDPEPPNAELAPDPPVPHAVQATLSAALDSLGRAHHRPYSRA